MRYIGKVLSAYCTVCFSSTPVFLWLPLSRNICSLLYLQCSFSNVSSGLFSINVFGYIIGLIIAKTLLAVSCILCFRTDLAAHCSTEITNSLLYLVLTSEFWEIQDEVIILEQKVRLCNTPSWKYSLHSFLLGVLYIIFYRQLSSKPLWDYDC